MTDEKTGGAPPRRIPFPAVDFSPPVYGVRRARLPFTLDGNLHKPFWDAAPFTELFRDIEGEARPAPRFATRAKMLWDDNALYIGAELEGDEIWGNVTKRDDVIFQDNDFEVFIDPDCDTHLYYEFEMNALNTVWDLLLPKPYRDLSAPVNSFDIKGLRTAVHICGTLGDAGAGNRSWSVEIVMPFCSLLETQGRSRPAAGEYWRMNFSRVQWKVDVHDGRFVKRTGGDGKPLPEDNWVWSPTGVVNIHYPELWGFAFFLDEHTDGGCEIPPVEYIKWRLRRFYYAQHAWWDRHGCFCGDPAQVLREAGLAPDDTLEALRLETTAHGFEISCKCGDQTVVLFQDGLVVVKPGGK